jgi:hypothetical protein
MRMERKRGQRRLIYSVSDKYLNDEPEASLEF